MKELIELTIPECETCGSRQIRTTKEYRICIRCGYREVLE